MAKRYLIAAALFGSTALVSLPVLAQDGLAFTLDATGGVQGFNLPTYDPGVFGHVAGGTMFGGSAESLPPRRVTLCFPRTMPSKGVWLVTSLNAPFLSVATVP